VAGVLLCHNSRKACNGTKALLFLHFFVSIPEIGRWLWFRKYKLAQVDARSFNFWEKSALEQIASTKDLSR